MLPAVLRPRMPMAVRSHILPFVKRGAVEDGLSAPATSDKVGSPLRERMKGRTMVYGRVPHGQGEIRQGRPGPRCCLHNYLCGLGLLPVVAFVVICEKLGSSPKAVDSLSCPQPSREGARLCADRLKGERVKTLTNLGPTPVYVGHEVANKIELLFVLQSGETKKLPARAVGELHPESRDGSGVVRLVESRLRDEM